MPKKKTAPATESTPKVLTRTERITERLLEAATQIFIKKGYDATSMTEIAAIAHASKETFYRRFPTKDHLFRAVVVRRAERMSEALVPSLLTHDPPQKALTQFGELVLFRMTSKDSIAFHRLLGMAREHFPEVLQLYRASGPFRTRDALATYLDQQSNEGRLHLKNPQVAARQFFDLFATDMILEANLSGKGDPGMLAIRQRVKEAVACFLHGYAR